MDFNKRMCFLRSFFFPRAAMMITCPGRQKTQLRNMTLMPNLIFFFGGGGIFRPAVAPVLSSVNTRVSRPGLEAHLHPLLSLKRVPLIPDTDYGWRLLHMPPGGTDSKADVIINICIYNVFHGFSYSVCSALQLSDIPLLHAVYIEHPMPL